MDPELTQSFDVFNHTDPGIRFDSANETWTISPDVLVSSGTNDGVHSDFNGSTLLNEGTILSGGQFQAGVNFQDNAAHVTNASGATIIGARDGIVVDGDTATIDNFGLVEGLTGRGVDFGEESQTVTLTNMGSISGGEAGVRAFANDDGGIIHNFGRIASDQDGIEVDSGTGQTTVITNTGGATIRGGNDAIHVELGGISLDNQGTLDGGILVENSADAVRIVNHGRINGAVELGPGNDVFLGAGGSGVVAIGGNGDDMLVGGSKRDFLFGEDGNDRVIGGAGNDVLGGGPGPGFDTLTGGRGSDQFVFVSDLDPAHDLARITDFTANVDKIVLVATVFTHLGRAGVLPQGEFHVGAAAGDHGDRIIYNPHTGFLFYDSDGSGGAAEIHFATVNPHLALHNTDFHIIPDFGL